MRKISRILQKLHKCGVKQIINWLKINLLKKYIILLKNYILLPGVSGDPKQYECNSQMNSAQGLNMHWLLTFTVTDFPTQMLMLWC